VATRRTKRLGALIQAELAELILRRIKDPRLAMVSVTEVDVSPDLSQAKVFFSPMEAERQEQVQAGFEAAAPFLRRELAARLRLKVIPRLVPVYDSSLVRGAQLTRLIQQARVQDQEQARQRGEEPGEEEEA